MFVGNVDLGNGTGLELVILSLKGTSLRGQWEANNDLLLLCVMQSGRFCTCRKTDHPQRFVDKLGLERDDAEHLAEWLKKQTIK
jgi:hypothetical protein